MPFRRHLTAAYITALQQTEFWPRLCQDRQLQPEIRNGVITVYSMGRALIRELRYRDGQLNGSIHHCFVPLKKLVRGVEVGLSTSGGTGLSFTETLEPLPLGNAETDVLTAYRRLMKFEAGPEGMLQQAIVCDARNQVLDQQVEFPRYGFNKIDLSYFDPSLGQIAFAEIKRADDSRLFRTSRGVEVLEQLAAYGSWVADEAKLLSKSYAAVVDWKRQLGLGGRLKGVPADPLPVLTKPVLVIGDCTEGDVRQFRAALKNAPENNPWSPLCSNIRDLAAGVILCGATCSLTLKERSSHKFCF